MDFLDLFRLSELKAIQAALDPSLESIWRVKCREYSQKYFTPLHIVLNELDPVMVMQTLHEDQYPPSIVNEELEEILEKLYKIKDPTYEKISKQDMEDLVDAVLNKEIARLNKPKPPTPKSIQEEIVNSQAKNTSEKPKSGGLNFDNPDKES